MTDRNSHANNYDALARHGAQAMSVRHGNAQTLKEFNIDKNVNTGDAVRAQFETLNFFRMDPAPKYGAKETLHGSLYTVLSELQSHYGTDYVTALCRHLLDAPFHDLLDSHENLIGGHFDGTKK